MVNEKFRKIITEYEKLVFTICYQMTGDYHKAQDLTQDTFLSAYLHIDSCKQDNLKPWLARIATNKAKDYLKSSYMKNVQLSEDFEADNIIRLEPSADDIYLEKEAVEQIKDKIHTLKEPYLNSAVMFFIEEKSIDEISQQLCRPKKTVQTQLYRAKLLLQKMLKEEDRDNERLI